MINVWRGSRRWLCGLMCFCFFSLHTMTMAFSARARLPPLVRTDQPHRKHHPEHWGQCCRDATRSTQGRLDAHWYGRGSDIWPPTNVDFPIRLEDSFPGGRVPEIALDLQRGKQYIDETDQRMAQRRSLRWVSLSIVSFTLALKGVLGPMDIGVLLVWSFYNYLLIQLANSGNGVSPVPPTGHVPHMARNPLQNKSYDNNKHNVQRNLDVAVNFMLPLALILLIESLAQVPEAEWCRVALGRPLLWWMTVQVADDILESGNNLETNFPVPLPIQYWTRFSSRFCRWALLTVAVVITQWPALVLNGSINTTTWTYIYGLLPVAHWILATADVFGYWIPVASMKYMRAHWAATEAEMLTIQSTAVHHYSHATPIPIEEQ